MGWEVKDYIAFVAVAMSLVSIYMSWRNAKEQGALTERLKTHDIEMDRKKLVTVLWDKIVNLWEIRPDDKGEYNETYIFENLNTLELIAACWANDIVDKRMVFLVCGSSYRLRVSEIEGILKPLKDLRRTGPELLQDRQIILNVNEEIKKMFGQGG